MAWWHKAIPIGLAVALAGAGTAMALRDTGADPGPSAVTVPPIAEAAPTVKGAWPKAATPTATPKKPVPHPTRWTVADALVPTVDLFSAPGVPLASRPTMANPTHEGLPVVFLVKETKGDWLHVQVSMRPNETTAWVQTSQVRVRSVPYWVKVEIGARRVSVLEGEKTVWETTAAVGSARTPTPVGKFFIDGWVPLNGSGPYGTGQLSVAGFSDVLQSFGGGVGQIAIHGTNRPGLLGQPVSNGCVRLENDKLLQLSLYAQLGTPVEVYP